MNKAEQMCNGREVEGPHSPEFIQAMAIYERLLERGMKPYRAEVNLYHEKSSSSIGSAPKKFDTITTGGT